MGHPVEMTGEEVTDNQSPQETIQGDVDTPGSPPQQSAVAVDTQAGTAVVGGVHS